MRLINIFLVSVFVITTMAAAGNRASIIQNLTKFKIANFVFILIVMQFTYIFQQQTVTGPDTQKCLCVCVWGGGGQLFSSENM